MKAKDNWWEKTMLMATMYFLQKYYNYIAGLCKLPWPSVKAWTQSVNSIISEYFSWLKTTIGDRWIVAAWMIQSLGFQKIFQTTQIQTIGTCLDPTYVIYQTHWENGSIKF